MSRVKCASVSLRSPPWIGPPWGWGTAQASPPRGHPDMLGLLGLGALGSVVVADRDDRGVRASTDVLEGAGAP
eukprot:13592169-Alexandrium_andersonii.AAC.1